MTQGHTKLPNMNEFSPGVLGSLGDLLETVVENQGDREALNLAIADRFERIGKTQGKQRLNRANNVLIGMSQCGLFSLEENKLTDLGQELNSCDSPDELHGRFATHLLVNCCGLELLDVTEVIRARGQNVTQQSIREELRARGFRVTENEGNANKIRKWMEPSGVVDASWRFSDARLRELLGTDSSVLGRWRSLTLAQRVLLAKLKAASPSGEYVELSPLKRLAETEWGRGLFPEGSLRKKVLDPLEQDGWIETEGKGKGRGGKIGRGRATETLREIRISLPLEVETAIPADLRDKLATPLDQIFADLRSLDTHTKGIALELLALQLIQSLGLYPVAFRLRSRETKGAEVDVVANGIHLHYSRWLFQCKNTTKVDVSDVAKEVGMALVLKAHVVAMVTTGAFASSVQKFARGVAEASSLQVVLISRDLLERYRSAGALPVIEGLKKQAEDILAIKRFQVESQDRAGGQVNSTGTQASLLEG